MKAGTKTIRPLLLGADIQAMQKPGGISIMAYYLPTLLTTFIGLEASTARFMAAISSVVCLVASSIAAPLVERFGRRVMTIVSTAIQFFCLLLMIPLLYYANDPNCSDYQTFGKASVVWFFIYYIGFGLGMLEQPWLYPTEINSLPMRTKGAAIATATYWLTNFIVVEVTPRGLQNLGWKFYIVWIVLDAAFLPILYLFYPETGMMPSLFHALFLLLTFFLADRSLNDIDAYYRENLSLVVIQDKDAISRKRPQKYINMARADIERAAASRDGMVERKGHTSDEKEV